MIRYLISDHDFAHSNIIEYCDRSVTSVGEMDRIKLDSYYKTVGPESVHIHLGDVAIDMQNGDETIEQFTQLDGDVLVRGNRDVGLSPSDAPFPVVNPCTIEHGNYELDCM